MSGNKTPLVSVVLPTYNEMSLGFLNKLVDPLKEFGWQKLAVDGGSSDGTIEFLRENNFEVISANRDRASRGFRLNLGAKAASGDVVLLHHPRSFLSVSGLRDFEKWVSAQLNSGEPFWGGFKHQFDAHHPLLKFTSWYSNRIRGKRGIVYLDHCIFFDRRLYQGQFEIPDVEIFEDTELCRSLRKTAGLPVLFDAPSTTSAVRFTSNGVLKQATVNQAMKLAYYMKLSHRKMNRVYEQRLKLNNETED